MEWFHAKVWVQHIWHDVQEKLNHEKREPENRMKGVQ